MALTFTSYLFLFVFLPIVIVGHHVISRLTDNPRFALGWLVLASIVFYATQSLKDLVVLTVSLAANFGLGRAISAQAPGSRARRLILVLGLVANLVFLGAYKYTGFLADNLNSLFGTHLKAVTTAYPVGMSFYTFIQMGFLIEVYAGTTERPTPLRYALFSSFFPYVTAGPIVRPGEFLGQLSTSIRERTGGEQYAAGATMFAIGLFKKSVLADSIAPFATTLFSTATLHDGIGVVNAWLGMAAYTLQLYFDFSGYTDMAIGVAHMLGLRLPVNFHSPLKATSIMDFWRRWHMTMTRFFTDFVFTPVTAKLMRRSMRRGYSTAMQVLVVMCVPMIVTFLMVGLWHGAGWGFVMWGAIQGVAISINLVWREIGSARSLPRIPSPVGWALTMATFMASLTFFRAAKFHTAVVVLKSMFGLGPAGPAPATMYGKATFLGHFSYDPVVFWVLLLAGVALLAPRNSQQLLEKHEVGLPTIPVADNQRRFRIVWNPSLAWSVASGLALGAALTFAGGPSPFLYYKF